MTTAAALATRASVRFRDPAFAIISCAEWYNFLEEGYGMVIGASPEWPFLETRPSTLTFAANDNTEALPSNIWRVRAVFNSTDQLELMRLVGVSNYRTLFPDSAERGIPRHYRFQGSNIEVYPIPQSQTCVILDALQRPTALTPTTEPVFPTQYHHILTEWALAQAYLDDGNMEQYQAHMAAYTAILSAMKDDLLGPREDGFPQILDDLFD